MTTGVVERSGCCDQDFDGFGAVKANRCQESRDSLICICPSVGGPTSRVHMPLTFTKPDSRVHNKLGPCALCQLKFLSAFDSVQKVTERALHDAKVMFRYVVLCHLPEAVYGVSPSAFRKVIESYWSDSRSMNG